MAFLKRKISSDFFNTRVWIKTVPYGLAHATGVHGPKSHIVWPYELIKTRIALIFGKKLKFMKSFPLHTFVLDKRPKYNENLEKMA